MMMMVCFQFSIMWWVWKLVDYLIGLLAIKKKTWKEKELDLRANAKKKPTLSMWAHLAKASPTFRPNNFFLPHCSFLLFNENVKCGSLFIYLVNFVSFFL